MPLSNKEEDLVFCVPNATGRSISLCHIRHKSAVVSAPADSLAEP